jgi:hypothetical protein
MDLANMRQNGVRSLAVRCHQCRHEVIMTSFGPRMVRTGCGIIGADARPHWGEQPPRETLTGVQWR